MKHIIVMGVAGCGKSTLGAELATRLHCVFGEGDAFHPAANVAKMKAGHPLTDEDRWGWLDAINAWMRGKEAEGRSTVVACSALKKVYRTRLSRGLPAGSVLFVWIKGDYKLIAGRMERRTGHFMPVSLLRSQFDTLEPPQPGEPFVTISASLPPERQLEEAAGLIADFYGGEHNKTRETNDRS